jgi:DNA polymerase-1
MRAAINAPLQGSAADIIKLAMIKVDQLLRATHPGAALVLQIHDELLIEAPDKGVEHTKTLMREVTDAMENVISLSVPLKVDAGFGHDWQEAQS